MICPTAKAEYFSRKDWTISQVIDGQSGDLPVDGQTRK
jgi:hypothetical protein